MSYIYIYINVVKFIYFYVMHCIHCIYVFFIRCTIKKFVYESNCIVLVYPPIVRSINPSHFM